ncbi:alanine--tRNA ligase [Raoultibacter massiliensis]|uniref:alanine--tRNA ligase n=1 Tax=Raoultibacter massiliensis TaxID=1852371 RepID=UPI000C8155CF|nr:alanine--tRNA ligase [Raoultibacter massiliensis]
MEYMSTADIREKYLRFFEAKGCKRMPSSSLIPDDPSLLLTSAGMVQFKPYFLQQKHLEAPYVGTTTAQKCVRTNDIDIIGTTGRHLSFFEMLGNFSFGDYFKEEMCAWALEFSTEVLGLPVERLYFTVFTDDDETIEIWKSLGIPEERISRLGEEDNFWRAGPTGPCGPCSELYYDQGPEFGCGSPDCAPGCDCDRYLEYWNLVFTQYDGQEDGTLVPLPKKNIDTGMGLERIAAIMQGVQSNYEIDLMRDLLAVGERLTGKTYGENAEDDLSLRIIADHSRSVTFMISDGILPSNEGRGYVLRRLLRRAVMKGHLLGIEGTFLNEYIDEVVKLMGDVYPEIVENRELTRRVVLSEEERFGSTLRQGQAYLDEALSELDGDVLSGETAFTLHDTYGFPIEVTEEITSARGISVDLDGFERSMAEQRARARANAKDADKAWSTYGGVMSEILEEAGPTEFLGYAKDASDVTVLALAQDGKRVSELSAGESGEIVCDKTPFYAEKGGQVGDEGTMEAPGVSVTVADAQEPEKGLIAHSVTIEEGTVRAGDVLHAAINVPRRERIRRNHTATHILHWALRQVLGEHVKQAGSYVAPNRLRFDFTHFEGMTAEQIAEVERLSNEKIMENHAVRAYETSITSAREAGVIALFGEKYGEFVRVLDIEGVSQELCGGTHVSATSEIGFVKVTSESSVGANLRRIEAVTSFDALAYMNKVEGELKETAAELKVPIFDVSERTAANLKTMKELADKRKHNKQAATNGEVLAVLENVLDAGYPLVVANMGTVDAGGLRNAWDIIRARMAAPGAVVLAADNDGTPILLAAGTPEAVDAGFDAGAVIKAISPAIKGGGGGKAAMAQAGGKDVAGLDEALDKARALLVKA